MPWLSMYLSQTIARSSYHIEALHDYLPIKHIKYYRLLNIFYYRVILLKVQICFCSTLNFKRNNLFGVCLKFYAETGVTYFFIFMYKPDIFKIIICTPKATLLYVKRICWKYVQYTFIIAGFINAVRMMQKPYG